VEGKSFRIAQKQLRDALDRLNFLRWPHAGLALGTLPLAVWGVSRLRRRARSATLPSIEAPGSAAQQPAQANPEIRPKSEGFRPSLSTRSAQHDRLFLANIASSQVLLAQRELNQLLKLAAEQAIEMLDAHSAAICLFESEGTFLELVSAQGKVAATIGLRAALQDGLPIAIEPPANDRAGDPCSGCAFHQACGADSTMSIPLQVGEHELGSICVVRDQRSPFDADERWALDLLGNSISLAIARAQLGQTSHYDAQHVAVLAERTRLAADIHDHLAQTLSYLGLRVDRARDMMSSQQHDDALLEIEEIRVATHKAYNQVRAVLNNLNASSPGAAAGLDTQIAAFIADFRHITGLAVDVDIDAAVNALSPLAQTQALHIVREALTNVQRHARATHVSVRARRDPGMLSFAVEDNGVGYDQDAVQDQGRLGLSIMQARAKHSGGVLTIDSEVGQGTCVTASFSLRASSALPPGTIAESTYRQPWYLQ